MIAENRSERAILVVDMINEFADSTGASFIPSTQEIIPFILGELQYFRERSRPVLFCNTVSKDINEHASKVILDLSPRSKEICINKPRPDAFFTTELDSILHQLNIKNLTIVGAPFHTSVLLTAAAALDLGYSVVVPETCVCSSDENDYSAALRILNRWLISDQMHS